MAKRRNWKVEDLKKALSEVEEGKLSGRAAAAKYAIPRSTLNDHIKNPSREMKCGPSPVLQKEEEERLVKWIIDMSEIGYGQCREQVCLMVKKILDSDKRPNPFPNNMPGKDWWHAFLKRHSELSLRTPQALQTCRAKACTEKTMDRWYYDFEQFLLVHDLLDKPGIAMKVGLQCVLGLLGFWHHVVLGMFIIAQAMTEHK